jgi:hypothetical protein
MSQQPMTYTQQQQQQQHQQQQQQQQLQQPQCGLPGEVVQQPPQQEPYQQQPPQYGEPVEPAAPEMPPTHYAELAASVQKNQACGIATLILGIALCLSFWAAYGWPIVLAIMAIAVGAMASVRFKSADLLFDPNGGCCCCGGRWGPTPHIVMNSINIVAGCFAVLCASLQYIEAERQRDMWRGLCDDNTRSESENVAACIRLIAYWETVMIFAICAAVTAGLLVVSSSAGIYLITGLTRLYEADPRSAAPQVVIVHVQLATTV